MSIEETRLTFIKFCGRTADKHRLALFECECGNKKQIAFSRVKNGYTKSCGCLLKEITPGLKHGYKNTPTYSSWSSAKARALNPKSKDYHRYGAVGIGFADRWLSFENFLADMGERPHGTSIDRIDNKKGYEPGNCRWASIQEQARNKANCYEWRIKGLVFETVYEAADHFGVTAQSVWRWVRGSSDKRRGTTTEPREDCHAIARY